MNATFELSINYNRKTRNYDVIVNRVDAVMARPNWFFYNDPRYMLGLLFGKSAQEIAKTFGEGYKGRNRCIAMMNALFEQCNAEQRVTGISAFGHSGAVVYEMNSASSEEHLENPDRGTVTFNGM